MKNPCTAVGLLNIMLPAVLLTTSIQASDDSAQPPPEQRPPEAVVYKPPLRGAPATRVGGGTRGLAGRSFTLSVLAPDHTGLTAHEQPTLYWFASESVAIPAELTIVRDGVVQPLLELTLAPPLQPGIHALRLKERGVRLEPDVAYQWFVALVVDPAQRANDIVAGGEIQRVSLPSGLRAKVRAADKPDLPAVYAEAGLWYDAMEEFSELIRSRPGDSRLRQQRAVLFEQIGLTEAAAYEKAMAGRNR